MSTVLLQSAFGLAGSAECLVCFLGGWSSGVLPTALSPKLDSMDTPVLMVCNTQNFAVDTFLR